MIRDIVPGDLDEVLALNQANTPEVGSIDRERLEFLASEAAIGLASVEGGAVAGFALVLDVGSPYDSVNYRWFLDRYDDTMYLDRVAIAEAMRGRGIGRALYTEVGRRMASHHPERRGLGLEVNVDPPNEPSMAFHQKLGFVEVGRQSTPYGAEVSLMWRAIPFL